MGHSKMTGCDVRILAARTTMASRITALEERFTESVQQAAGTIDHATASIRETVDQATDNVQKVLRNFTGGIHRVMNVEEHPWRGVLAAFGSSLIAQFLNPGDAVPQQTLKATAENLSLMDMLKRELANLGKTAIATASKMIQERVGAPAESSAEMARPVIASRNGAQRHRVQV